MQHTSQFEQYAVVIGRKIYKYRRPVLSGKKYREPRFIGIEWFRSRKDAEAAKSKFDKPLH